LKYLYFILIFNSILAKGLHDPYYELTLLKDMKNTKMYNTWVPMYQEKMPEIKELNLTQEMISNLKSLYRTADIIAILEVTDFKIYSCKEMESGLNIKYKAIIKTLIKGIYKQKNIIFVGDFDNAPYARNYEQIYILYKDKEGVYYSDEFFQYDVQKNILKVFNNYKKIYANQLNTQKNNEKINNLLRQYNNSNITYPTYSYNSSGTQLYRDTDYFYTKIDIVDTKQDINLKDYQTDKKYYTKKIENFCSDSEIIALIINQKFRILPYGNNDIDKSIKYSATVQKCYKGACPQTIYYKYSVLSGNYDLNFGNNIPKIVCLDMIDKEYYLSDFFTQFPAIRKPKAPTLKYKEKNK